MEKSKRHQQAAVERWNPTIPKATHSGILKIADLEIPCDVLQDGKRMIRRKELLKALGRSTKPGSDLKSRALAKNLPVFLCANNLTPYLEGVFSGGALEKLYKSTSGKRIIGFEAKILTDTCEIYLKARQEGVLTKDQVHIAHSCEIMMRSFAKIGLTALIDECTGFQEVREKNELQTLLEKYIAEELRPWTKKFPDEFFKQSYRLQGWSYPSKNKNHPQYLGKLINTYVYDKLPPGILNELKRKNPPNENGNRLHKHHQFLTEKVGDVNLDKQILQTITVMKISEDMKQFKENMEKLG